MGTRFLEAVGFAVALACLAGGASAAGVLNGDFENATDLEYWATAALAAPDPSYAVVEEVSDGGSDVLHLLAKNTFTWNEIVNPGDPNYPGWWSLDQFFGSTALASNPLSYDLYAPVGTTAVQFDAKVAIQIPDGADAIDRLWVEVSYNFDGVVFDDMVELAFSDSAETWTTYTMNLPSLDTGLELQVQLLAGSGEVPTGVIGDYDGQVVDVVVEGWFDDVQFIPEPITAVVLMAGGVALLGRRRR